MLERFSSSDVATIPEGGTWFQQITSDGTVTINTGANGLQKLDKIVELAQKHGIYVQLSLTNNWNPLPNDALAGTLNSRDDTSNGTLPRNTLSNDYGATAFIYIAIRTLIRDPQVAWIFMYDN
jgi:mannan endo-1,4-beta-mannosidase